MVICLERSADLHMAQMMPLPLTVSCFSKIQIGFTFLVPAHLGSPRKRAVKRVCLCVCVLWQLNEARLLINNKNTCCKQRHAFVALYRKFLMNIQPYFCGVIAVWAGPRSNSWSGNNKSTFLRVGIARCPSHRRTNNNKTVTRTRRNHPLTSSFLDTPNYFRGTKSCTLYSGSQMPVQFRRDISQKYLRLN